MGISKLTSCNQFTYSHYADLLEQAKEQGYAIGPFRDHERLLKEKRCIILRHDVDFSLSHALKMAALEHSHGVQSTYFILLHSPSYNPLTEDTKNTVKAILELGHELGLHYDPRFQLVTQEAELLSQYFDTKVTAIARHNPFGVKIDVDIPAGFVNAYSKEFFKEIKYVSDSSQHWREGCLCGNLGRYDKIQVLIHPEWWSATTIAPDQILADIGKLRTLEIERRNGLDVANLRLHREKMLAGLV